MADVIKSYLVSLSSSVDVASFSKFQAAMAGAEKTVAGSVSGILGNFLKFQVAGTSAFATVGFGIIGYIDKLAMADQKTKLLATQNMMSTQQYRAVSTALDTLGVSLDDVFFGTKELQDRFHALIDDQKQLALILGPSYELQMQQVRDVAFQLQRLEVKGQYFGMKFASDLLEKLGFGNGGIAAQLSHLNDFIMANMPRWSDELSTDVIPVLEDFFGIMKDTGTLAIELGKDFTQLVGILSDDDALQKNTVGFHEFAQAIEHVVHWLAEALHLMLAMEQIAAGGFKGAIGTLKYQWDFAGGNRDKAQRESDTADQSWSEAGGGLKGLWGILNGRDSYSSPAASPSPNTAEFMQLIRGIAQVESDGSQFNRNGSVKIGPVNPSGELAVGMMQLLPSTAARLGVNPYDAQQNLAGGEKYLAQLLARHHGNVEAALADYGGAKSQYSPQGQAYIQKVERSAGIQVGSIIVHVPTTSVTPDHVAQAVKRGVQDGLDEYTQHLIAATNGAYQ